MGWYGASLVSAHAYEDYSNGQHLVYVGSANLTGAGMGMKSAANRNFEAGFLTDEPGFIDAAMSHFDSVWEGTHCKSCGRKDFCIDRI